MDRTEPELRKFLQGLIISLDGLTSHAPTMETLAVTKSETMTKAWENKLYGYFAFSHGVTRIYGQTHESVFGWLNCKATFSNGQEGMGDRKLGVIAEFVDEDGKAIIRVSLEAYVRDPIHKSGGAQEEHRSANYGLTPEQRDAIAGVRLAWPSDLHDILKDLMDSGGKLELQTIPIYPLPSFKKFADVLKGM